MNNLTRAREFCFQYLFHLQLPVFESLRSELSLNNDDQKIIQSIQEFKQTSNHLFDDNINKLIVERIKGTLANYKTLEILIEKNLKNWKLSRLSKVDLTNLILATYELKYEEKTPTKVIINEAIEITKKFGTDTTKGFINGVLDNIAKSERTCL